MNLETFANALALNEQTREFIRKHGWEQSQAPGRDFSSELTREFILEQAGKIRKSFDTSEVLAAAELVKTDNLTREIHNYLHYYWMEYATPLMYGHSLPEFEHNPVSAPLAGALYAMMALATFPIIEKIFSKLGLPEKYALDTFQYFSGALAEYAAGHDGKFGLAARKLHWFRFYIDGILFRIGRLEYMIQDAHSYLPAAYRRNSDGAVIALCRHGWKLRQDGLMPWSDEVGTATSKTAYIYRTGDTITGIPLHPEGYALVDQEITLDLNEYTPLWNNWDLVPGIHIPGGGGMKLEACRESLLEAREFFEKYFNRQVAGFSCASWIFNTDFEKELPESNLAQFMRQLYIFPFPSHGTEGLFFVFGKDEQDYSKLPADNTLRRAFHSLHRQGKRLKCGGMFIEARGVENFGNSHYRQEFQQFLAK